MSIFRPTPLDAFADVTWDKTEERGRERRFWDLKVKKYLKWLPRTDGYASEDPRTV